MIIFELLIMLTVNLIALILLLRHHPLPQPFPWYWSLALLLVLAISGIYTKHIERPLGYISLLSAVIVTSTIPNPQRFFKAAQWISILLVLFLAADMFQIIKLPKVFDDFQYSENDVDKSLLILKQLIPAFPLGNIIHRPMELEHANVKATWLLLLPLSLWTGVGVIIAQSRGALLGLFAVLATKIQRRFWIPVAIFGLVACVIMLLIRSGSAFSRLIMWEQSMHAFITHPLFGLGTGNFSIYAPTAHNVIMTIAAENGLFGLVPFLGWLISLVLIAYHSSSPARWNLLAFGMQQLVDDQWLGLLTAILVGINLAILILPNWKKNVNADKM